MLPDMAVSISASLGFLLLESNAVALINWPDWQ
jgi:hypothetical protein